MTPHSPTQSLRFLRFLRSLRFARILRFLRSPNFLRSPGARLGAAIFGLFVLAAVFGPWLAPASPTAQDLDHLLESPSRAHLLGTDEAGCDLLSQILHGARLALDISTLVVSVSLMIGLFLGILAGYVGGLIDELIMRNRTYTDLVTSSHPPLA